MVLLGGVHAMAGPIVGALVYTGLYDVLLSATDMWRLVLGLAIVLLVLVFPEGIAGTADRMLRGNRPEPLAVLRRGRADEVVRGVSAVNDVSFSVAAGEMLALIGPNGAGKSTCFNMLGGQLRPDSGRVVLLDREIAGLTPAGISRLGVGRTFQVTETFSSMTVRENVQMGLIVRARRIWRLWRAASGFGAAEADRLLGQVGLGEQAERGAGVLAYGDLKRLELAMAMASHPRLLLMDEPTAGMAPGERIGLMRLVRALAARHEIAVLFTEHDMDVVFGVADRVLVTDWGESDRQWRPGGDPRRSTRARGVSGRRHELMLSVQGLQAQYGRAQVLTDVSFEVGVGEAWVLLGRNGAGKSTTLKSLVGLVRPSSGSVRFMEAEIAGWAPWRIARLGLGYVPEERRIFTELTVMENLEVGRRAGQAGGTWWGPERLFTLFPNLGEMRDRLGGEMSGGEQQMLSIARTLMGNPRMILLDEPSEGLAPLILQQLAQALAALKRDGVTMLLAEQNLRFAARVADRAVVIETGRAVWDGTVADLQADAGARDRYLAV